MSYELTITRVFDAPRELVWKAWTDPAMAKQWMGPRGFANVLLESPCEAGKPWKRRMEGKRGDSDAQVSLGMHGTTLEVRPPEFLKYTFAWDERESVGLGPTPYKENVVTLRFEEQGDKTVLHFHQAPFDTEGERDGHNGGWSSSLDMLAEFLARS